MHRNRIHHAVTSTPRTANVTLKVRTSAHARRLAMWLLTGSAALALLTLAPAVHADGDSERDAPKRQAVKAYALDRSGDRRIGEASYYDDYFFGRKMANGEPMEPESNNAASKTLPLGTKARVRNLENGRSAVVEITDRGPYIEGRIIDLSPRTARQLGILKQGVARVEVKPIDLPEKADDGPVDRAPRRDARAPASDETIASR
jgi:rare lipoprotein A